MPLEMEDRVTLINRIFFLGWLALTVVGCFWNTYTKQNKNYLILGGVLTLSLPLANGFVTGLWPWVAWSNFPEIAMTDISWSFMGIIALFVAIKWLKVKTTTDRPGKEDEVSLALNGKAIMPIPKMRKVKI